MSLITGINDRPTWHGSDSMYDNGSGRWRPVANNDTNTKSMLNRSGGKYGKYTDATKNETLIESRIAQETGDNIETSTHENRTPRNLLCPVKGISCLRGQG